MAINIYTPKDLRLITSMVESGYSAHDIAKKIGRTKKGMMRKGREIGLSFWPTKYKKQTKKHIYTNNDLKIVKELAGKKTLAEISDVIGVSPNCIYQKYSKMGISFTRFNENHHNCKYSSHDVELIRQLHDEGLTVSDISKKFEICHQTISDYTRYKSRIKYDHT